VPWDSIWHIAMFLWADAFSRLGLAERAGELYELLVPSHGQLAVSGALTYGSIDWALGTLATTLGRYAQAEVHFSAAPLVEKRLGAPLFLARTQAGWARALIAAGNVEDLERAQAMLEQAGDAALKLGAQGVAREVSSCRAALVEIG